MRGARLLLGTAMAGSRMAAAIESDAMSVVAQRMIDGCWQNLLARKQRRRNLELFAAANQS